MKSAVYAPRALRDIDHILRYLHARSPQGASNVSLAIERSAALCARNPSLGRRTDEPGIYRWPLPDYDYALFFRVLSREHGIEVVRVINSRRLKDLGKIPREI